MSAFGHKILYDGAGDIVADIWLVHGLRGHRIDTWTKKIDKKSSVCWPSDLLKEQLPNVRVLTWGYDSSVLNALEGSSQASIYGFAENLLHEIHGTRIEFSEAERLRPIIFVTHSLGGIVVKQALIRSAEYNAHNLSPGKALTYQSCKGVIFLGTPHRGSGKGKFGIIAACAAKAVGQRPNSKLIRALERNSDALESQRRSFTTIACKIPLACIYEELPTSFGMIVEEQSATIDMPNADISSIAANHTEMCKFACTDDPGYRTVSTYLRTFVQTIEKAERELTAKEMNTFLKSLAFEGMYDRQTDIEEAHEKTFRWILDDSEPSDRTRNYTKNERLDKTPSENPREAGRYDAFRAWMASDEPLFWFCGKAGSGKSTLMKHIWEHPELDRYLTQRIEMGPVDKAAFFCVEQSVSDLHKSGEGLLRSLLHQILRRRHDLLQLLLARHRLPGELEHWRWKELRHLFLELLNHATATRKLWFFVDGLDEYRPNVRGYPQPTDGNDTGRGRRIDEAHERIVALFQEAAGLPNVKFVLASRPLAVFERAFETHPYLSLEHLTEGDISSYVYSKLCTSPRFRTLIQEDPCTAAHLTDEIIRKACGVFLWVSLVVKELVYGLKCDKTSELLESLDALPSELTGPNGLYMRMLLDIDPVRRAQGFDFFNFVRNAPYHITALRMYFFNNTTAEQVITMPIEKWTPDRVISVTNEIEDRLRSRTAGILELVDNERNPVMPEPFVRFIHRTAKEFVQDPEVCRKLVRPVSNAMRKSPDPNEALLISSIALMKLRGIGYPGDIKTALDCITAAEESTGVAQHALIESLDSTVHILWQHCTEPSNEIERECWGKSARDRGAHWTLWLTRPIGFFHTAERVVRCTNQKHDLLSLAVEYDWVHFLETEIPFGSRLQGRSGRPLLSHAINKDIDAKSSDGWVKEWDSRDPSSHFPRSPTSHPRITAILLEHGADPNEVYAYENPGLDNTDSVWQIFLSRDRFEGQHAQVRWHMHAHLLVEFGALPNAPVTQSSEKVSPLLVAVQAGIENGGYTGLAELLQSRGARFFPGEREELLTIVDQFSAYRDHILIELEVHRMWNELQWDHVEELSNPYGSQTPVAS